MDMIDVSSSQIAKIGYAPTTQTLRVLFRTGGLYDYAGVIQPEYETLMAASITPGGSIGKEFNTIIKPRKKPTKIEARPAAYTLDTPEFKSEKEEAEWFDNNQDELLAQFQQAAKDGTLTRGTLARRVQEVPAKRKMTAAEVLAFQTKAAEMTLAETKEAYPLLPVEPITVVEVDSALVIRQAAEVAARASSLEVLDEPTHIAGQELMVSIAETKAAVTAFFAPMKKKAHEAHAAICDQEKSGLTPLLLAQGKLSSSLVKFRQAQEQARQKQEAELREAQRIEAKRLADEEAARIAAEDAAALEAAGDTIGAAAVLANPTPVPAPYFPPAIVPSSVTRVTGAVAKKTWKARIVNPALIPRDYLKVDEAAIQAYAARSGEMAKMPGVEFYSEESIHGRRGK